MNNLREWRLLINEIGSCKDNQRDLAQEVFAIQDFLRQEFGIKFNHFLKSRDLLDSESEEHELAEADNYPDEVTNNSDLAESDEEEIFEDESKQNHPDNYSEDTKNSDLAESDQEEIYDDEETLEIHSDPQPDPEDTKDSDLDSTSLKPEQSWEDSSEYDEEEEREDVDVDIEIENLLKEDEFNLENFSDNDDFEESSHFSGRISRASSVCSDVHDLIRQQLLQEFIVGSNGKPKTQDEDKTLDVHEEEYENIYQKSPPSVPSPKRKKKHKRKKIAKHNDSENEDSKYQDQDQKNKSDEEKITEETENLRNRDFCETITNEAEEYQIKNIENTIQQIPSSPIPKKRKKSKKKKKSRKDGESENKIKSPVKDKWKEVQLQANVKVHIERLSESYLTKRSTGDQNQINDDDNNLTQEKEPFSSSALSLVPKKNSGTKTRKKGQEGAVESKSVRKRIAAEKVSAPLPKRRKMQAKTKRTNSPKIQPPQNISSENEPAESETATDLNKTVAVVVPTESQETQKIHEVSTPSKEIIQKPEVQIFTSLFSSENKCELCHKVVQPFFDFEKEKHLRERHTVRETEKKFVCRTCYRIYSQKGNFELHMEKCRPFLSATKSKSTKTKTNAFHSAKKSVKVKSRKNSTSTTDVEIETSELSTKPTEALQSPKKLVIAESPVKSSKDDIELPGPAESSWEIIGLSPIKSQEVDTLQHVVTKSMKANSPKKSTKDGTELPGPPESNSEIVSPTKSQKHNFVEPINNSVIAESPKKSSKDKTELPGPPESRKEILSPKKSQEVDTPQPVTPKKSSLSSTLKKDVEAKGETRQYILPGAPGWRLDQLVNKLSKPKPQNQIKLTSLKESSGIAESPIKEFPPPETIYSPPKEIIAPANGESKDLLEKSLEESAAIAEENDNKAEVPVEVKAVDKTKISRLPVQATVEIPCIFCYFKSLRKEQLTQHMQAVHKSQWNDFLSQSSNTNDNVVEEGNEVSNCLT